MIFQEWYYNINGINVQFIRDTWFFPSVAATVGEFMQYLSGVSNFVISFRSLLLEHNKDTDIQS